MKMIKLLQFGMLYVCEIQAALGLARSSVSKHLNIPGDAGLIFFSRDGLRGTHQLADGAKISMRRSFSEISVTGWMTISR